MVHFSPKYKSLLAGLFLVCYLISAFQSPLLEVLHFVSHFQELAKGEYVPHNSHSDSDHEHESLELAKLLLDEKNKDAPVPPKKADIQFKKYPQICSHFYRASVSAVKYPGIDKMLAKAYSNPFLDVSSPPPKV